MLLEASPSASDLGELLRSLATQVSSVSGGRETENGIGSKYFTPFVEIEQFGEGERIVNSFQIVFFLFNSGLRLKIVSRGAKVVFREIRGSKPYLLECLLEL